MVVLGSWSFLMSEVALHLKAVASIHGGPFQGDFMFLLGVVCVLLEPFVDELWWKLHLVRV